MKSLNGDQFMRHDASTVEAKLRHRIGVKEGSKKSYGLRPRNLKLRSRYADGGDAEDIEIVSLKTPRRTRHRMPIVSKYRRRTANARERDRMKEMNDAFSTLRQILPDTSALRRHQVSMTKIRTLKLAVSYIQSLSDILSDDDSSSPSQQTDGMHDASCDSEGVACDPNVVECDETQSQYADAVGTTGEPTDCESERIDDQHYVLSNEEFLDNLYFAFD